MVKDYEIKDGKYILNDVVSCFDVDSNIRMKPVAFMNIAQEWQPVPPTRLDSATTRC